MAIKPGMLSYRRKLKKNFTKKINLKKLSDSKELASILDLCAGIKTVTEELS